MDTDADLRVSVEKNTASVSVGARPVLQYRYADVPFKPYVRELYTPSGVNVLRDAPADHLHHHALMFALGVDGATFWAEVDGAGKQLPHTNPGVEVEDDFAWFSGLLPWCLDSRVVLREYRQIHAVRPPKDEAVTLITWRSQLMPDGDLTLTGNHYFGLGMRFVESMDTTGVFRNSTGQPGKVFRGDERLVRAAWCAYAAPIDGKPVTVAMFDHPDNTRHPATWFTMAAPFAYLSATMNLHAEPLPLKKDQVLDLYYGVAVWDGQVEAERIEKVRQYWLKKTQRPSKKGAHDDDSEPSRRE